METNEMRDRVTKIIEHVASHKAKTDKLLDHYLASMEKMAGELELARAATPNYCATAHTRMRRAQKTLRDLTKVTRLWRTKP